MIIMPERLQELMDELKIANAETYYHSIHVKTLACRMIKLMNEDGITSYTKEEIAHICKGAILHDVGKLYVKNVILTKDSRLTEDEMKCITEHTRLGFEAVESSLTESEHEIIKNICLYHHERVDGAGYEGMVELPLYVQIVSACDVFDALNSNRIYRDAIERDEAIRIIESGGCGTFDKVILKYLKIVTRDA